MPSCFNSEENKFVSTTTKIFVPIDHHAKFKMFKLSFVDLIKNAKKFVLTFLGHFQKSVSGFKSMCKSIMASRFSKMVLKVF